MFRRVTSLIEPKGHRFCPPLLRVTGTKTTLTRQKKVFVALFCLLAVAIVPPRGVQNPQETLGNHGVSASVGANVGAITSTTAPIDPDLALLVECWPSLPAETKVDILTMVRPNGE